MHGEVLPIGALATGPLAVSVDLNRVADNRWKLQQPRVFMRRRSVLRPSLAWQCDTWLAVAGDHIFGILVGEGGGGGWLFRWQQVGHLWSAPTQDLAVRGGIQPRTGGCAPGSPSPRGEEAAFRGGGVPLAQPCFARLLPAPPSSGVVLSSALHHNGANWRLVTNRKQVELVLSGAAFYEHAVRRGATRGQCTAQLKYRKIPFH